MISIIVTGRFFGLVLLLTMFVILLFFRNRASKGKIEQIRKLPGIDAIDEAVGRSIELGKPTLVTYSFDDSFSAPNLIGLETIRYVSKQVALKGGKLLVGAGAPRTLPVAIENYRLGTVEAGAPELFDEKNVYFFTQQQWAYASGVMGLMQRENPAACVFIGPFLIEGIHLGINARRIGTISIGGNTDYSMGAFMFITMDYTLLGEEVYAAGAYMSENPLTISSLATEDVIKWFIGILVVLGSLTLLAGSNIFVQILGL